MPIAEEQQSEFNSALATLERIHNIKILLDTDVMKEDYIGSFPKLTAFWIELDAVMSKDDRQENLNIFNDLFKEYWVVKRHPEKMTFELVQKLISWNISLRRIDQELNMNIPKAKDPRFSLARK